MATYKEKNGTTRVGDFLRSAKGVAPVLLNLAGDLSGIEALNLLGDAIKSDTNISTQDKETALKLLKFDLQEQKEVTKRWESDMSSDSWLSKNVRPLSLIFLTLFMTFIIFSDSKENWSFDVKESYIDLLKILLVVVYSAYFGSRGIEKINKIKRK